MEVGIYIFLMYYYKRKHLSTRHPDFSSGIARGRWDSTSRGTRGITSPLIFSIRTTILSCIPSKKRKGHHLQTSAYISIMLPSEPRNTIINESSFQSRILKLVRSLNCFAFQLKVILHYIGWHLPISQPSLCPF
ncbi:GQ67_01169T0 [Komagataella phaffii]|nr:GQ67_01169T0 [Komagataella phaffii]AOA67812.1 GQ68_00220T0 [Komagataella phaffii GS115]